MDAPIPLEAPVTTATLLLSLPMVFFSFRFFAALFPCGSRAPGASADRPGIRSNHESATSVGRGRQCTKRLRFVTRLSSCHFPFADWKCMWDAGRKRLIREDGRA